MRISDFKVGQTVFIVPDNWAEKGRPQPWKTEVAKVGRTQLTINEGLQFAEPYVKHNSLIECTDYGGRQGRGLRTSLRIEYLYTREAESPRRQFLARAAFPRRLFLTEEAVTEYYEQEELKACAKMAESPAQIDHASTIKRQDINQISERGGEPKTHVYAKTTMETMPASCTECAFGRRYGCVGDVECRVLRKYFTGNVEPPYKERPDECPLVEMRAEPTH